MKTLKIEDLQNLAIGCAILGSGGGGDPVSEVAITKQAIHKYGPIELLNLEDLKEEDLILPVAIIGAPLVALEKLRSGREFLSILDLVEKMGGRRPTVLMAVEIGGANGFAALSIAGQLGLPVLNGDLMGRAFPQLEMTSCTVKGVSCSPVFLADAFGNATVIEGRSAKDLEKIARHVAISMGSSSAIAFRLLSAKETKEVVIGNTLSQAIEIGRVITEAKGNPVQSLLNHTKGTLLGEGTIVSVDQSIQGGFLHGNVKVKGAEETYEVLYQNEYLLVKKEEVVIGATPDIFMLLETESGTPLTTESLRYGLRVSIVALPAPRVWKTEEGLALVGPERFGYLIKERNR